MLNVFKDKEKSYVRVVTILYLPCVLYFFVTDRESLSKMATEPAHSTSGLLVHCVRLFLTFFGSKHTSMFARLSKGTP